METYEEYCEKRLKQNCIPVSEIEWATGLTPQQIVEKYKTDFKDEVMKCKSKNCFYNNEGVCKHHFGIEINQDAECDMWTEK